MSGFIPKEKLSSYQHWDMPDLDSDDVDPALENIRAAPAQVENTVIPKEKLTAYERWELAAFDQAKQQNAEKTAATIPAEPVSPQETPVIETAWKPADGTVVDMPAEVDVESEMAPAVVLPTAVEIEQMHEQARQQGYQEGYQEGHTSGQSEGSAQIQEQVGKLDALLTSLDQSLRAMDQEIAEKLLATAVELASQMVHQSLKIRPDIILPIVQEAMNALNPETGYPSLLVHPDDASIIRENLSEKLAHGNWRLIEDKSITPGGCRVELGAGEVDATCQTRWKRILESIGINQQWLDDKS